MPDALSSADRHFVQTLARLIYTNPFRPERIALEQEALGEAFEESESVWSLPSPDRSPRPNVVRLAARTAEILPRWRAALLAGCAATRSELEHYEDLALYHLYDTYRARLHDVVGRTLRGAAPAPRVEFWAEFQRDFRSWFELPGRPLPSGHDAAHHLACFFQIRRAFHHIHDYLIGRSPPAARLRAAVWESIFTHDMRRFRRTLYARLGDVTTLIRGASGTGKELVAQAIGLSRYIPFDARDERFADDFLGSFHPLNLSALSPTLIESELFGHCRGAFTGAVGDRAGWLEVCRPLGSVFLDEIGELDAAIQVKLLRVLQTRTFQRLGETTDRRFNGKIIAATHRDLAALMQRGQFREDFYYRICADTIVTPTLREQVSAQPDDLRNLVAFVARRIAGAECEPLTEEVVTWIERQLPADYPWPGNFRELEQCVRGIMIRREYHPANLPTAPAISSPSPRDGVAAEILAGSLTADEVLKRYTTLIYARERSYEQAAQKLGLDRRTVKAKVDFTLLARLQNESTAVETR